MSLQTDDMQSDNRKGSGAEFSFGGFSDRISYERFGKNVKPRLGVRLFFIGCICIFAGVAIALCGLLMYQVVQHNKGLYYPDRQCEENSEDAVASSGDCEALTELETTPAQVHFADVTPTKAARYGLPQGVMVRDSEFVSQCLSAEIFEGDIIVSLGDTPISDSEIFYSLLTDGSITSKLPIVLFRNNEPIIISSVSSDE